MKIETKKIDACKREISIEIPKELVSQKFDEIYKEIGKKVQIKGFRPGKAPRDILESRHSDLAREEVLKDLIPSTYKQAIEKEKLDPVDLPEVSDVQFKENVISFKAKVEIRPEVKIKNYKSLRVKRKKTKVSGEDIDKSLDSLKKSQGLDDKAAIDDAFAKGLGHSNLADLKENIKKQMEIIKDQQARQDVENQIIEQLLKNSSFELPESSVRKQLDYMVKDAKMRLSYQGMKKEDVEAKDKELREQLKEEAKKAVRIYFILDKIAQLENLEVKEEDQLSKKVMEFLLKEAQWLDEDAA